MESERQTASERFRFRKRLRDLSLCSSCVVVPIRIRNTACTQF